MSVRCKFVCQSVKKTHNCFGKDPPFLFEAAFSAVTSGSEENKKFFQYTPSGRLEVGTYKEDVFEVGKEYYLDLTPAS